MKTYPILSHYQADEILQAKKSGKVQLEISLDLGITKQIIKIIDENVLFPENIELTISQIKKVSKDENKCYIISGNTIEPIIIHSEKTSWVRTLYPTASAPTTLVSGLLMHRIKDSNPLDDTLSKIKTLEPLNHAVVLDTATGLGYTAIELAKRVDRVVTIEIDPAALEIASFNPYSQELFDNPKITQIIGDIEDEVKEMQGNQFTHILHDPPTFKIAGQLYSTKFYLELYRLLKNGGRLFHYIGNPQSEHGAMVTKGVLERLKEVGFYRIEKRPESFGVLAIK